MLSLLAIPIINETATIVGTSSVATDFFARPIDVILFDVFIWFGWIPIVITLFWGFIMMWKNAQNGKYVGTLKFVLLSIDVPAITEQTPKAIENLFANIYGCKSSITFKEKWVHGRLHPVFSFEIISTEGYIQFLVRTQTRFRDIIEAGIYAHYPDAEISEVDDYCDYFPKDFPNDEIEMWGGELTLDKHWMYPIRTYVDFEDRMTGEIKDPMGNTLEQLARMRPGEHFWIQYLVQPSTNSWVDEGIKRAREIYGIEEKKKIGLIESGLQAALEIPSAVLAEATNIDVFSVMFGGEAAGEDVTDPFKAFKLGLDEREEAEALIEKTKKVGHGVKIRILYLAKKNAFVKVERTGMVKGILNQLAHGRFNRFTLYIPQVPKDDYFWMRWAYTKRQKALMAGYCSRSFGTGATPVFLNAEELATLWHFPAISIKAPLVKKAESRKAEPPVGLSITMDENVLPNYQPDVDEGSVVVLPGTEPPKEKIPGTPMEPGVVTPTGAPPIGLPGMDAMQPLSEAMPSVVSPTAGAPVAEVPLAVEPEVQKESEPVVQEPAQDMMPPEDLLPSMHAPTTPFTPESEEDDHFVPPNLPM